MTDKWYTVSEAAGLLGVSTETVRRHIRNEKLEGKKEGNQYVVKLTNVRGSVPQSMTQLTAINVAQLESSVKALEERKQMLEKRVRELEEDKGFLLKQIAEKDQLISRLTPLALPEPRISLRNRIKRMFGRSESSV